MPSPANLVVPCNWQDDLLQHLDPALVDTVYGKLAEDALGGGRPSCKLPGTDPQAAMAYIARVRQRGIHFNYVLNSACTANSEFTEAGYRAIADLVDWVAGSGADLVTVASPFVADLLVRRHPNLGICTSKFAFVSSPQQARFWQDAGAGQITVDPRITRSFRRLEAIRAAVDLQLVLLVNEACLLACPQVYYHANCDSHASQQGHNTPYVSYSRLFCGRVFTEEPEQVVKATFIRPEDVERYERLGIDRFKLVGRVRPTAWIARAIKAYGARRYDGNLADLMGTFSTYGPGGDDGQPARLGPSDVSGQAELERLRKSHVMRNQIAVDNRALDGYLEHFEQIDCESLSCDACGYCAGLARRAVRYGPGQEGQSQNLRDAAQWVLDGRFLER